MCNIAPFYCTCSADLMSLFPELQNRLILLVFLYAVTSVTVKGNLTPPQIIHLHLCVDEGKLVSSRVHTTPGSLQRSRSDIDVNAASSAKSRLSTVPASSPFSSAAALPPGSYASLGNPSVISLSPSKNRQTNL